MHDQTMTWEEAVRWCLNEPSMAELARAAYFGEPVAAATRYHASAEFGAVRAMIPPRPGRAIDLGAGNGILSYALAREGWQVAAVEPDPSALVGAGAIRRLASETDTLIEVIEAFGEAIPLEAAGYDLVVARQVLHHAYDLPAFCREMARLASDDATILTLRDHVITGPEQRDRFLRAHPLHHLYRGESAFTLAEYRAALQEAGLIIKGEFNSFQSVLNYDPMTQAQVREKIAAAFGPLSVPVRLLMSPVPFRVIGALAARFDRRPGRLVSFLCRKGG